MGIPEHPDPIQLFGDWFDEALNCGALAEPTAMTLATVDAEGQPWARVVLLKGHDADGFVFYTNTTSTKGVQLAANPKAALNFYWMPIDKQVRVLGTTHAVTGAEADAYFAERPRGSQLGAWASDQSKPLSSRAELEQRLEAVREEYEGRDVPRPPYWSGYRLLPHYIEFWLKGPDRLHYRRAYTRHLDGTWSQETLYP